MGTKEIFESHPISNLRKAISKTNIKGYSKMKKDELVALMVKNKERFQDIKPYVKPVRAKKPKPAPKPKQATKPKATPPPATPKKITKAPTPKPATPLPQKPSLSQVEKATGLSKAEINKMNPLELFALLPTVAKAKVSKNVGEDFLNSMEELEKLKGFKKTPFRKQIEKLQADIFEKATGRRARYSVKKNDYTRLVKNLRKDTDLQPGQLSYLMNVFNELAKNEIKQLKPLQPKPRAKKPRDRNALTNENLFDYYLENLHDEDYENGVLENLSYSSYPGTRYDDPEEMSSRLLDRVYSAAAKRMRRLIADYRKQKKPKTLEEAEKGLKEFSETHELDDYILKNDLK